MAYEYTNIFYMSLYFSYNTVYLVEGVKRFNDYTFIASHILYAIFLPYYTNF